MQKKQHFLGKLPFFPPFFFFLAASRSLLQNTQIPLVVAALLLYFMVCEIDLFHFISHAVECAVLKSNLPLLKH